MILYPAIDLKDGACVRLMRGAMDAATVYSTDPAGQARTFQDAGCRWLHLVDLNGAVEGHPVNAGAVAEILQAVSIPVQLGGGIRDMRILESCWNAGWPARSLAPRRSRTRISCARRRGPFRAAWRSGSMPARVGSRRGLEAESEVTVAELAQDFADAGIAAIIHTDIERDGVLAGPNVAATAALAEAVDIPVIASGGVSSLDDLRALKDTGLIAGAISGRALYEGKLDLGAAMALLGTG